MGIPPDSIDRGNLGGIEGRAGWGEQNIKRGVNQERTERVRAEVVDQSIDWKTSFANHAWSILWVAVYQASRSVPIGHPKGMVAIWLWMFNLRPWQNFTTRVWESVYPALMGIKRFDHKTKVKARSERRNLQAASQLCTKQVGTGEINQIIESLLKVEVQRITKTY